MCFKISSLSHDSRQQRASVGLIRVTELNESTVVSISFPIDISQHSKEHTIDHHLKVATRKVLEDALASLGV
jgi:predicted GNAT superfamily acetyltransferase